MKSIGLIFFFIKNNEIRQELAMISCYNLINRSKTSCVHVKMQAWKAIICGEVKKNIRGQSTQRCTSWADGVTLHKHFGKILALYLWCSNDVPIIVNRESSLHCCLCSFWSWVRRLCKVGDCLKICI